MTRLLHHCPLGCASELETTDIILPEGALEQCPQCNQMISVCTLETFDQTMLEWDCEDGTMPTGATAKRHRKRISKLLDHATAILGKSAKEADLLDVGCSSGSALKVAEGYGFATVRGVEPATAAASTARDLGYDVFIGLLEDARYESASFDVVLLFEVIEHLPEPLSMIREIQRILKPGGVLLLSTGNACSWTARTLGQEWTFFSMQEHGGHISFFSPKSIERLASVTGFQVADIQTRRYILTESHLASGLKYRLLKTGSELLSMFANLTGNGHQMYAYLQKPG